MPQKVRIALDAMGGDVGASVVVPGAAISLARHPDAEFVLVGNRALIEEQLAKYPKLKAASRIVHTDVAVSMEDKPSQALRRGRKTSSMWLAIDAVKRGEADVAVSAGNTGALMAMARFHLHMLEGIDRPAIAAVWPTVRGDFVVLDLGATIGGDARHLVALAVMGGAMARVLFNLPRPTVGLLNIGTEEIKGHEEIREAGEMLRAMNLPSSIISALSRATASARAPPTSSSPRVLAATSRSRPPRARRGRSAISCGRRSRRACWRRSATSSPRVHSARCATSSTRKSPMAACSWACEASWSKAMAERTPRALPTPWMAAMRWSAAIS